MVGNLGTGFKMVLKSPSSWLNVGSAASRVHLVLFVPVSDQSSSREADCHAVAQNCSLEYGELDLSKLHGRDSNFM